MVLNKGILPPGYRFQPSDRQIIKDYLVRKVENILPDVSWFIFEKEIYKYSKPFLLFQEIQRNQGYFFTPITKVSSSGGKNVNRKTGDGTWRGQKPTTLLDDDQKVIGTKRMYNFEWDVPKEKKSEVEREKGHWIMHEYSLPPDYYTNNKIKADPEYVLCEIRSKIPILDVNAVREEEQISQPVAKRQRTSSETSTMPPDNGSSISWVPSQLPAETTISKFVDSEAAPVSNNVSDWVASSPRVFNNVESNGELSEAWFPTAPLISNAELSEWVPSSQPPETMDPYVPVPVPAPTAPMPEFDSLTDDGCGDFFLFDNYDLVPAVEDNNFSLSSVEEDCSLLQQAEDEDEEFAELLEGALKESNKEPMMISELGSSDIVAAHDNDAVLPNVSVRVPVSTATSTSVPDFDNCENHFHFSVDDLLTSEDNLNISTPRDNSYTYYESKKALKASDSEAVKISKLGWDPVAYKAYFPNFEPMY